jgi:hypothetical protein
MAQLNTLGVDHEAPAEPIDPKPRKQRRLLATVSVLIVLALVGGVLVAVLGSRPNADAAIIKAVDHALGDKTAQVKLTENISEGGKSTSASGTGAIDFNRNAYQLNLRSNTNGKETDITGIFLGGTIYENIPGISQIAPGKSWVSLDLSALKQITGTTSVLSASPLAALNALAQQGATVTDLGSSIVDRRSVEGYLVTFDASKLEKQIQRAKFPTWMQTAISSIAINSTIERVYLNGQSLVEVSTHDSFNSKTLGSIIINDSCRYSNYGTPVAITTPSANEVIPFTQFLKLAGTRSSSNLE